MHGLMLFHHKHRNDAERSPSAHFLCHNVVEKKGGKSTSGGIHGDAALLKNQSANC